MKLLKQIFTMLFAIGAYFSPLALNAMKPPHQIGNPNARVKIAAPAKLGKNQIPPIKAPKKIGKPETRESKKFSNRQWVGKKKVVLPVGQGERIVIEEEKLETPNAEQAKPNAGLPASEKENAQAPEATSANAGLPTSQAASESEKPAQAATAPTENKTNGLIYRNALEKANKISDDEITTAFTNLDELNFDEFLDVMKNKNTGVLRLEMILTELVSLLLVKKPAGLSEKLFNNVKDKIFNTLTKSVDLIKDDQLKNDLINALNKYKEQAN